MAKEHETGALLISIIVLFLLIYGLKDSFLNELILDSSLNSNFVIYIAMSVLFFMIYGISLWGGGYIYPIIDKKETLFLKYLLPCATLIFIGSWLIKIYLNENNLFPENSAPTLRHDIPILYGCASLMCCAFFVCSLTKEETDRRMLARYIFAGVTAFGGAILFFTPVLHRGDLNAFFNSIYETLNGYPYTDMYTSIYGHYAILYMLPIKILGGSINDIYRVIAVVGFITFVAIFIALANVVERNDIYFLTCIAILGRYVVYFGDGNYYQVIPHRWLFPALFTLLWSLKKSGKVIEIISYFLLVLAIVWNLDSGLVLLIAYAVYRMYEHIREKGFENLLLGILLRMVLAAGCFLAAYSIVGIYNISAGGKWGTIKDFIYPYLSEGYHIADLMVKIPGTAAVYGVFVASMLGMLSISMGRLLFKRAVWKDGMKFFVALVGSGMMFYYMNRAAYGNVTCCSMECVFLLGLFLDEAVEEFHVKKSRYTKILEMKGINLTYYVLSFFIVVFMSSYVVETTVYYGKDFYDKMELWDNSERNDFADRVEEVVPKDTFAFGASIPELYYQLGWDTGCHVMDWADLNDKSRDYIQKRIETGEMFFADEGAIFRLLRDGYYPECEATFIYAGNNYYYARLQYIPQVGNSLDTAAVFYGINDGGQLAQRSQLVISSGENGKIIIQYDSKTGGVFRIGTDLNGVVDYECSAGKGEIELSVRPNEEIQIFIFQPYSSVNEDGFTENRIIDITGK